MFLRSIAKTRLTLCAVVRKNRLQFDEEIVHGAFFSATVYLAWRGDAEKTRPGCVLVRAMAACQCLVGVLISRCSIIKSH